MFKIFKLFVYGLMVLDVAVLPFSCSTSRNNVGELYIYYICTNEEENEIVLQMDRTNYIDFSKRRAVTDELLQEEMNRYFENSDCYILNENGREKIKITSYTRNKVTLYGSEEELILPYTITNEDRVPYFAGLRNAYIINVYVNIEYQLITTNEK